MPWFDWKSERIHYELYQVSQTQEYSSIVVMIHGLGLNLSSWKWLLSLLPRDYRILCYDLRGHGQSTGTANLYSINDLQTDLAQLLDHLNLRHVDLVGHGIGGTIALRYARAFPERVKTITLISTQLFYPQGLDGHMSLHRRSLTLSGSIDPIAGYVIERICNTTRADVKRTLMSAFRQVTLSSYFRYFQLPIEDFNALQWLPTIRTPVLHITGEYDRINPPYFYGFGMSFLPYGRFVVLPGASNAVHTDDPQTTAALMQEHLMYGKSRAALVPDYSPLIQRAILTGLHVDDSTRTALQVFVLQGFRVYHRSREIQGEWNQRKAKELLLFLVFNPVSTRESVATALWPSATADKARSQLRGALHHLKTIFSQAECVALAERLDTSGQTIALQGGVESDLIYLLERLMDVTLESNIENKTLGCHEILDSLSLAQLASLNYEWVLGFRDQIETQISDLAEWLGNQYYDAGQYRKAVHYYRMAAELWTVNETVYDHIIEIYTIFNDPVRARVWQQKRLEIF